jgi:LemA protein
MWIAIIFIVVVVGFVVMTYNGFVSLKNRARNAWSDIDVQLKRRYDLIPNLVETVKGYASHEKSIFEDVARLRSGAMQIEGAGARSSEAEAQLSGAIKTLFAVAESYPDLKADQNFRDLQKQLTEVEDNVQYSRRYYNAVVRDFNTKCELFPSSVIGSWFGFKPMQYFQASEEERGSVRVDMTGGDSK